MLTISTERRMMEWSYLDAIGVQGVEHGSWMIFGFDLTDQGRDCMVSGV